jgi:transcriptional regulator with XRE-family HTH domain
MENIGEIMRKLRVDKNYSQEFVADRCKIDYTTYSRYERGETQPRFETIIAICDLYKMSLDDFRYFGDPDSRTNDSKLFANRWSVQVIISLDGTVETLNTAFKKLTAMNATI